MLRSSSRYTFLLIAALLSPTAVANGTDPIFTFGFTELDGSFTGAGGGTGSFQAVASAVATGGPFDSSGDVTRVLGPKGTAEFNFGFVAGPDAADFQLHMDITDITANSATGSGDFTVTDANGDTITGTISGTWGRLGSVFGNFEGLISNVMINDNSGDGTFDGPDHGSFSTDFGSPPFNGAIIVLETGSWFTSNFDDTDTQVHASVVPAPGALLLGALGLGLVGRLQRRLAA